MLLGRVSTPVAALEIGFLFAFQRIRIEHKCDHQSADKDGHIDTRGLLDITGDISHLRDRKHRLADDVACADQRGVHIIVRIALGAVADDGRIIFIRNNLNNTVRSDHIGRNAERDNVVHTQIAGVHALDINQRPGGIGRFHRAGQHTIYLYAEDADTCDKECKYHRNDYQAGRQDFQKPNQVLIHYILLKIFLLLFITISPAPLRISITVQRIRRAGSPVSGRGIGT